jgi:glycerol dehydrogenase
MMGDTLRILGAPALYMQGPDASLRIGDVAAGLGRNVLFVSDAAVERLFAPRVRQSVEASGLAFSSVSFTGDLTPASVERMASAQQAWQPEVVIAAGGGKGVDAGKGITMKDIYKSTPPFIALQGLGLLICAFAPQVITWLPRYVLGQ